MSCLYLKHRPADLTEVEGNGPLVAELTALFNRNAEDIPHAFMLYGPSGCGKTTISRIMASMLDCDIDHGFHEMDSAQYSGIDSIRELRRNMQMAPMAGSCVVYLLDECHKLSSDAQTALLKALEDTPRHVYFILATTDPDKMIPTIRNRCTKFEVEKLSAKRMTRLLAKVCKAEGLEVAPAVIEKIVDVADGSPRSALVNLDKIKDMEAEEAEACVREISSEEAEAVDMARLLMKGCQWKELAAAIKAYKGEPESARRAILGYFGAVLLNNGQDRVYLMMDVFRKDFFTTGRSGLILACFEAWSSLK